MKTVTNLFIPNSFLINPDLIKIKTIAETIEELFRSMFIREIPPIIYIYDPDLISEILKLLKIFNIIEFLIAAKIVLGKCLILYLLLFFYNFFSDIFKISHYREDEENKINFLENIFIILGILYAIFSSQYQIKESEINLLLKVISVVYTNGKFQLIILTLVAFWIYFQKNIQYFFENNLIYKMKHKIKRDSICMKLFNEIYIATLHALVTVMMFFLVLVILLSKMQYIYNFLR